MPEVWVETAERLVGQLQDFDPALLSAVDCARAVQKLSAVERVCAAARARAAARAVRCGAHKEAGYSDGSAWLAQQMGSSTGDARMVLETATAIESSPEAKQALIASEISLAQSHEITKAAGDDHELVELARRSGLSEVRDAVRDRTFKRSDPDALHRRQRTLREFKHWIDREGMVRGSFAFTPEVGIPIVNRLEVEADRLRRQARTDGNQEQFPAFMADALVAMLSGKGRGHAWRADLVIVCDVNAFRRGHTHEGEVCHAIGGGPLPVEVVRELSKDAFLKAVIHDGTEVHTINHFGRYLPAELRTALEMGAPPGFEGAKCEDCSRRHGLQVDHVDPVANRGPTSLKNLEHRCTPCHWDKTERDRQAGLLDAHRKEASDVRVL